MRNTERAKYMTRTKRILPGESCETKKTTGQYEQEKQRKKQTLQYFIAQPFICRHTVIIMVV